MSMAIEVECPSGHTLKVPSKLAGHSIACPVCDARFFVEQTSVEPAMAEDLTTPSKSPVREEVLEEAHEEPREDDSEPTTLESEQVHNDLVVDLQAGLPNSDTLALALKQDPSSSQEPPSWMTHDRSSDSLTGSEETPSTSSQETSANLNVTSQLADPSDEFSAEQLRMFDDVATEQSPSTAWILVDIDDESHRRGARRHSNRRNLENAAQRYTLAVASIIVAFICAIPSVLEFGTATQFGSSPDAWTYCVLLGCLIQLGIAVLIILVPDWSTHWIGAITTTGLAGAYALVLALTMFAGQGHELIREMGLPDEVFRNQAQPWCFLVMSMTLILAYFFCRSSVRWRATAKLTAVPH